MPYPKQAAHAILKAIRRKYPKFVLVITWNQPMLQTGGTYPVGVSVKKTTFYPSTKGLAVKQKTSRVPKDWKVDKKLLKGIVKTRLAEVQSRYFFVAGDHHCKQA